MGRTRKRDLNCTYCKHCSEREKRGTKRQREIVRETKKNIITVSLLSPQ